MSSLFQIDGSDIEGWSNRIASRSALPSLVRRLVRIHGRKIVRVEFRADEGVQIRGWDGSTFAEESSDLVPIGTSAWEMGTGKDPEEKATSDYAKRTLKPIDVDPKVSTFVFVTSRRWDGKKAWEKAQRDKNEWNDVRVYDADDLAMFLEGSMSVSTWLAMLMGKHVEGCVDLDYFWTSWSNYSKPPILTEFLTVERESACQRIIGFMSSEEQSLAVQAEDKETAVAFVAAAMIESSPEHRDEVLANVVVVETIEALRQLAQSETPLILVSLLGQNKELSAAIANGHKVIVPVAKSGPVSREGLILPSQNRSSLQKILEAQGMAFEDSRTKASLARRSMTAFRRSLNVIGAPESPEWSEPSTGRELIGPMLAGQWNADHPGDQAVLAELSGRPYQELEALCTKWAGVPDPPVRRVGRLWSMTNRAESWSMLARFLTNNDLETYQSTTVDTLSTPDPKFELEQKMRYAAEVMGKGPDHSYELRDGLAQGLALMGATSEEIELPGYSGDDRAHLAVRKILEKCTTANHWASISSLLPLLAEAAPDEFLTKCEEDLATETPLLLSLFQDGEGSDSFYTSSSPHTSLLWALETLGWSPEFLSRTVLILASLASREPGGKLQNRPSHSLREIFLPWHPSTSATVDQRVQVLDLLRKRKPDMAKKLILALLPENHGIAHPTSKPEFRDWADGTDGKITLGELIRNIHSIVTRFVTDAGLDGKSWAAIFDIVGELPKEDFYLVTDQLSAALPSMTKQDQEIVHEAVRRTVSHHIRFPGSDWSLPAAEIEVLKGLTEATNVAQGDDRFAWLFKGDPDIFVEGSDWRAKEVEVQRQRAEAVRVILNESGLPGLIEFAEKLEFPGHAARALFVVGMSEDQEHYLIEQCMGSENIAQRNFAASYVGTKVNADGGIEWAQGFMALDVFKTLKPLAQSDFHCVLPFDKSTWDSVEQFGNDVKDLYWDNVSIWGRGDYGEVDGDRVVSEFLRRSKPIAAIEFIGALSGNSDLKVSPELGLQAVESLVESLKTSQPNWQMLGWSVGQLLDKLHVTGVDLVRLAQIEYLLYPVLHHQYERGTTALYEFLNTSPYQFVSFVRDLTGEHDADLSEEDKRLRHERAFDILHSWHTCPGFKEGELVDIKALENWITQSRELAKSFKAAGLVDEFIGSRLQNTPHGPGGQWPMDEVCEIIESLASSAVDGGFRIGISNSRGVTWREQESGGAQERLLVTKYWHYADLIRNKYPRVAKILADVSKSYAHHARREDIGAELNQDRD